MCSFDSIFHISLKHSLLTNTEIKHPITWLSGQGVSWKSHLFLHSSLLCNIMLYCMVLQQGLTHQNQNIVILTKFLSLAAPVKPMPKYLQNDISISVLFQVYEALSLWFTPQQGNTAPQPQIPGVYIGCEGLWRSLVPERCWQPRHANGFFVGNLGGVQDLSHVSGLFSSWKLECSIYSTCHGICLQFMLCCALFWIGIDPLRIPC